MSQGELVSAEKARRLYVTRNGNDIRTTAKFQVKIGDRWQNFGSNMTMDYKDSEWLIEIFKKSGLSTVVCTTEITEN